MSGKTRRGSAGGASRAGARVVAAMLAGLAAAACGGGPPDPPPPPSPPPPPPASLTLDLAPGERVTLTAPADVRAFRLKGGDGPRTFEVIVKSASTTPGQTMEGRISVVAERPAASLAPARAVQPVPSQTPAQLATDLARRADWFRREQILRERTAQELERTGTRPVVREPGWAAARRARPALGDTLQFTVGVDEGLFVDCRSTNLVRGVVRHAGEHFTVVEDLAFADQPAADRFSDEDFRVIGRQLEEVVYPTDAAYFGEPADIDGNGSVIALITAEVNKLTDRGETSIVAGFFLATDLGSASTCPASNEAEIFYLVGPDPDEDYGARIRLEFAHALARSTVAHELVHLLNTQQRIPPIGSGTFGNREEAWLDEGMAHLAEELSGLGAAGLGTRANLDLEALTASEEQLEIFNHFLLLNFHRFGRFLRGGCPATAAGPAGTRALGDSDRSDPGGVASLSFRGFAYGFVRWLGDQFGEEGSGGALLGSREEGLFRQLASGGSGHRRGVQNVRQAIRTVSGVDMEWDELLALYLTSLIADDAPGGDDARTEWKTWNLPALYEQLSQSNLGDGCPFTREFPLTPTNISLHLATNSAVRFEVNSSTGRFLRLSNTSAVPDMIVELTDGRDGPLPNAARPQVTILRSR